ncbi:MAG TPA: NmrA/HSCARG family protein [Bryobacteraceae bacterium]|nr:NmrA/HSCARG family protein [Bryobacteraceae bacterium]
MAETKIIAVLGATGAQGGGLVRAIQDDPRGEFRARALTRDIHSERARALAASGAEVVAADADDAASLRRAFEGAHGAYCVTFYWNHFSPEKESAQAAAMAQAAGQAGVRHVIWSTLEDTRRWVPLEDDRMPTLMRKYKVPHFDAKGESDRFFSEAGLPVTFLLTSFYWDNFISFGIGPQRQPDGTLAITFPLGDRKMPGIAAEDIGRCAYGVFQRGEEFIGKRIGIAGEHLTGAELAAALSKALGEQVRYIKVTPTDYRRLGFPGADDLGNMFQFKRDFEKDYCAARDVELSRALNPRLQTFETWLAANKDRIPLKVGTASV